MKAEDLGTGNGAKHDCLPLACPCPLTESTWLAQEDNFHPPHLQSILLLMLMHSTWPLRLVKVAPFTLYDGKKSVETKRYRYPYHSRQVSSVYMVCQLPPQHVVPAESQKQVTDMLEPIVSSVDNCMESTFQRL